MEGSEQVKPMNSKDFLVCSFNLMFTDLGFSTLPEDAAGWRNLTLDLKSLIK